MVSKKDHTHVKQGPEYYENVIYDINTWWGARNDVRDEVDPTGIIFGALENE